MKPIKDLRFVRELKFGLKYRKWSYLEAFVFTLKGIIDGFYLCLSAWTFKRKWRKRGKDGWYFDFNGAKLPDMSTTLNHLLSLMGVFEDSFLSFCFFNDRYDKSFVEIIDKYMHDGPYGYVDGSLDVTVKKEDVVIDAGAWIGDFSAYSAAKGAICYAFEPVEQTFQFLCKTATLNPGFIHPVKQGLGEDTQELTISIGEGIDMGNSAVVKRETHVRKETISITTLDKFVKENNLSKIDFIKADIEGAERDMLRGATNVLKTLAPKLAICTYHLPDDPQVLEKIILDANPNYTVVHTRHKLFATVIHKPTEA
jgi:FkbM family methyltransferase